LYKNYIKRILDIIFSLILIIFILPIILIFCILIKIEDGGPIFYLGERLGKNKRVFKMYKLRSMKVNAPDIRNKDGSTYNSIDDSRLTKIGRFIRKTSIDELPQIVNILKGDMSFIGPRPDLPEHLYCYENDEVRKLEVFPGVSGYNQAYQRNAVVWKERLKNDVYYVDHISFNLDLKILYKTIFVVILRRGVYNGKAVTRSTTEDKVYGSSERV
jgi:undecaprenyl phosphate N,N'-diacetylbacillosamine 1-phosphate transferase